MRKSCELGANARFRTRMAGNGAFELLMGAPPKVSSPNLQRSLGPGIHPCSIRRLSGLTGSAPATAKRAISRGPHYALFGVSPAGPGARPHSAPEPPRVSAIRSFAIRRAAWRCLWLSKVRDVQLRDGPWRTGASHKQPQPRVEIVGLDVNPSSPYRPRRRLQSPEHGAAHRRDP